VCALAHFLEAAGVATIVIGLIPQHVRAMRPPRALLVPFPLGRPLGAPGRPDAQREVLSAALALLERPGPGPVLETYESMLPAEPATSEPWSCPVTFAPVASGSDLVDRVLGEIRALQPWFVRAKQRRGHSGADVSGLEIEAAARWLGRFLGADSPIDSPVPGRTLAATFKLAVEDLKAFYLEAVTAQPGDASAATLNDWFWDGTAASELLRALREELRNHPDERVRLHSQATLVPRAQLERRTHG